MSPKPGSAQARRTQMLLVRLHSLTDFFLTSVHSYCRIYSSLIEDHSFGVGNEKAEKMREYWREFIICGTYENECRTSCTT